MLLFLSLAKPEDVQYFKFDELGNMYVYEPGAGCSGLAEKVSPGEDFVHPWGKGSHMNESEISCSGFVSTMSSEVKCEAHLSHYVASGSKRDR